MGKEAIKPEILTAKNGKRLETLKNDRCVTVVDRIKTLLEELFFIQNPPQKFRKIEKNKLERQIINSFGIKDINEYGCWVFYPWNNTLVHLPKEREYQTLRTTRNRYLITDVEQLKLSRFKVGVLGLSVGNSISNALSYLGVSNSIKLADPDHLDATNLNRLRAGLTDLGENKSIIAAKQIYEVNPFADIEVFPNGVSSNNISNFLSGLNLLIEETDDFELKVVCRIEARKLGIPVVMVTDNAEEVMLDIERYDLDKHYPLFHGLAGDIEKIELGKLSKKERIEIATKIVGKENITPRMSQSLKEVGRSLVSWPQLATTVFAGGGIGAYVVKQIALENKIQSKRFKINVDKKLLDLDKT